MTSAAAVPMTSVGRTKRSGSRAMGTKNNPAPFDCYENADPDEPMFILLARDASAPGLVRRWVQLREERGGARREKLTEALECAKAMEQWKLTRPPPPPTTVAEVIAQKFFPDGPPSDPLLQFFEFGHLSVAMQAVSRPFCELAYHIVVTLPRNPERTVALRKLLEAKDCAVRSTIFK